MRTLLLVLAVLFIPLFPQAQELALDKPPSPENEEAALSTLESASTETESQSEFELSSLYVPYQNVYVEPVTRSEGFSSWKNWFLCFTISLALIPIGFRFLGSAFGIGVIGTSYITSGGGGAGIQSATTAYLLILAITFMGVWGISYCIYQFLSAYISQDDRTLCCTANFLGSNSINEFDISPDGRWLMTGRETPKTLFMIGDKVLPQPYAVSMMDLETGRFVIWPESRSIWFGIDQEPQRVLVDDKLYYQHRHVLSTGEEWFFIDSRLVLTKPAYLSVNNLLRRFTLLEIRGNEFVFSDLNKNGILTSVMTDYRPGDESALLPRLFQWSLSDDGRVLMTAKAFGEIQASDGALTLFIKYVWAWIEGHWEVRFWDVESGSLIALYKGFGMDAALWTYNQNQPAEFILPSADGRLWYIIKESGFIHVFDLRNQVRMGIAKHS